MRQLAQLYNVSHEWLANGDDAIVRDAVQLLNPNTIVDGQQRVAAVELMKQVKRGQLWRLETDMMAGWNLRANDVVVVEPIRSAQPNDVVIADYQDKGCLVRVYFPPYLYALPLAAQPAPLIVDGKKIIIVGIVREWLKGT